MITFCIELTKEDFYQFSYYTNWSASWNFKKRVFYHLKNFIYGGTAVYLFLYFTGWQPHFISIIGGTIFLLSFNFVILPIWIKHNLWKYVEKFSANPSNSSFFLKTDLVINEKGILSKDDVSTTMHSWPAFVKKAETEGYFYLYLNSQLGLVIPKRAFTSQKEKAEFESILLAHFPLEAELKNLEK